MYNWFEIYGYWIRRIFYCLFICAALNSGFIYSQNLLPGKISGYVKDANTNRPIEFVTVYLANTSLGCNTNSEGYFEIANIPSGTFTIICTIVGHSKRSKQVTVSEGTLLELNFLLKPSEVNLKEITVIARDDLEWQRNLRKFTREFLGEGENFSDCEILNPEVIELKLNKERYEIEGSADEELNVINRALGYSLKIYLKEFVWSRMYEYGHFLIYPYFTELKPRDEEERKEWEENREKAYNGSLRHFLKACADNRVYEEGFRVSEAEGPNSNNFIDGSRLLKQEKKEVDLFLGDYVERTANDEFILKNYFFLQITYINEDEDIRYGSYRKRISKYDYVYGHQNSWIRFPSQSIRFTKEGLIKYNEGENPYSMTGYLAWQRVSDLLPFDYVPPKNKVD